MRYSCFLLSGRQAISKGVGVEWVVRPAASDFQVCFAQRNAFFLQYAYDSQDVVPNISSVPKSVFTTQRSRPHYSLQACCSTNARHSTAHLLHSSAQRRQWSISCLQHSSAQTRHISAHALQSNEAFSPPIIMSCAVETQNNEHSISSWIQGPSILTLSSLRHSDAQCLHSAAQAMHASMHRWNRSWLMFIILWWWIV